MITYQRIIFKTFNSIISIKPKLLQSIGKYDFSSDNGKDEKYEFPFNFNREQYRGYIKRVQKAKQEIAQVEKLQAGQIVPRRKRRLYDRPKHDTELAGYAAWRLFDIQQTYIKFYEHGMPILAKLKLQPKWVVHAFGKGIIPLNNRLSSHRQFVFEDNSLSKFILYEYRNTTLYKKNIPDYDYENQEHLRPEMRQIKRMEPAEFWESEQQFEFRLNGTAYAEHLKFCRWLTETIQKRKTQQSYDSIIDKKFSKAFCYNEKADMEQFQPNSPFIMHVTPQSYEIQKDEKPAATKGKKQKKDDKKDEKKAETVAPVEQKPKAAYNFSLQLDEQYRKEYKPELKKKAQLGDF